MFSQGSGLSYYISWDSLSRVYLHQWILVVCYGNITSNYSQELTWCKNIPADGGEELFSPFFSPSSLPPFFCYSPFLSFTSFSLGRF